MIAISSNPAEESSAFGSVPAVSPSAPEMQRLASHRAVVDELTGTLSRSTFQAALARQFARQTDTNEFSLLILNLDGFKQINETLGHPAGDKLLSAVSQRLNHLVSNSDLLGRLGGDEFAIAQFGGVQPESSRSLTTRIADRLSEPFEIDGQSISIGVSVGIAISPCDGTSADALLRSADLALCNAKCERRGVLKYFEPEMEDRIKARRELQAELKVAIVEEEFQMYYQPIMDLQGKRIVSFEALVRWVRPLHGIIAPDRFIPLAEETGLIAPLGQWILRSACQEARQWSEEIRLAVNLSPVQLFDPLLVDSVVSVLSETGFPAHRLELEITETALMTDSDLTINMLHRLREQGIQIALDDFGTGYSSINYLRRFPFDRIKIDRSFVSGADQDEESIALVRMIASLASILGVRTTAEGVETTGEFQSVRQAGCTEVQGYLFNRPVPAHEIPALFP